MPNIASILKTEIARVTRKEMRSELESLRKSTATYRREIAALKKRVQLVERQLGLALKGAGRSIKAASESTDSEEGVRQLRFSATRFAAQRRKSGLSAAKYAKLLGVSPLSVYKWESGKTRPRQAQLVAMAGIRSLGSREAAARLEHIEAAE